MSAFPAGFNAMSAGAPCRYGAQRRPLRERLTGAGAAALAHGVMLGAALAIGMTPRAAPHRPAPTIVAVTTAAAAGQSRQAGRRSMLRPAAMAPPPAAGGRAQSQAPVPLADPGATGNATPPQAPAPPAPPAPALPPPAAPARAEPDAASQRAAYLRRLWLRIMDHRPAGLGLAGTVTLGFRLDGEGHLAGACVTASSGIALLDRAALQALRRAAPFPAPPAGAQPGGETFVVEIRFG